MAIGDDQTKGTADCDGRPENRSAVPKVSSAKGGRDPLGFPGNGVGSRGGSRLAEEAEGQETVVSAAVVDQKSTKDWASTLAASSVSLRSEQSWRTSSGSGSSQSNLLGP